MHIADGVLPLPVLLGGGVAAAALTAAASRRLADEELPRVALAAATFFTGSSLGIPVGPTSVHLYLGGLAGVVLGARAPLAVAIGAGLQCLFFQHGGLTALGVNIATMGSGALVAGSLAGRDLAARGPTRAALRGGLAAASGAMAAIALYAGALLSAGEAFANVARLAVLANLPLCPIEGFVAAAAVRFLARVEPGLLAPALRGGSGAAAGGPGASAATPATGAEGRP